MTKRRANSMFALHYLPGWDMSAGLRAPTRLMADKLARAHANVTEHLETAARAEHPHVRALLEAAGCAVYFLSHKAHKKFPRRSVLCDYYGAEARYYVAAAAGDPRDNPWRLSLVEMNGRVFVIRFFASEHVAAQREYDEPDPTDLVPLVDAALPAAERSAGPPPGRRRSARR